MSTTPNQATEPTIIGVKARDVTPYRYGIWCSIAGRPPFVNQIVHRKWSEDGTEIVFMLESFNFDFRNPDEEMGVVDMGPDTSSLAPEREERDRKAMDANIEERALERMMAL